MAYNHVMTSSSLYIKKRRRNRTHRRIALIQELKKNTKKSQERLFSITTSSNKIKRMNRKTEKKENRNREKQLYGRLCDLPARRLPEKTCDHSDYCERPPVNSSVTDLQGVR